MYVCMCVYMVTNSNIFNLIKKYKISLLREKALGNFQVK